MTTLGIPELPRRSTLDLLDRAHHRRRRREVGHREALARHGSGFFEIALAFRGDAFRVVYAVQLAEEVWVVHAFQKKSTKGIKTPKHEIDLIKDRLKRLKDMLG